MRKLILAAAALIGTAAVAAPASAQSWGDYRDYNREVRAVQRDCYRDLRRADSRREYRRERQDCRRDLREVRREYRSDIRDDRRDDRRRWNNGYYQDRSYGYGNRYWDGRRWRGR